MIRYVAINDVQVGDKFFKKGDFIWLFCLTSEMFVGICVNQEQATIPLDVFSENFEMCL